MVVLRSSSPSPAGRTEITGLGGASSVNRHRVRYITEGVEDQGSSRPSVADRGFWWSTAAGFGSATRAGWGCSLNARLGPLRVVARRSGTALRRVTVASQTRGEALRPASNCRPALVNQGHMVQCLPLETVISSYSESRQQGITACRCILLRGKGGSPLWVYAKSISTL